MSDSMRAFIEGMPKCELHVHLEGTLEPELKFALARRNDLSLPYASADEMRAAYDFDDLSSFLAVYYEGMEVLLKEADFYDLKGNIEALLKALGIEGVKFISQEDIPYLHPARSAYVVKEDKTIGYLGEIHPEVKEAWDLKHTAFVFELDIDVLLRCIPTQKQFKPLPKFPFTSRDAAFIVPLDFVAQKIEDFVYDLKVSYLEEVSIIDVYQGKGIPEGTKSLTYRFVYRASDRTLTDEEVERIHNKIVDKILKQFQITVR
jgi:phenylalanyl-tRNA synthetase beta chain